MTTALLALAALAPFAAHPIGLAIARLLGGTSRGGSGPPPSRAGGLPAGVMGRAVCVVVVMESR